ncbi:uncharacterized protein LOC144433678 [Glandiceps talaboti]
MPQTSLRRIVPESCPREWSIKCKVRRVIPVPGPCRLKTKAYYRKLEAHFMKSSQPEVIEQVEIKHDCMIDDCEVVIRNPYLKMSAHTPSPKSSRQSRRSTKRSASPGSASQLGKKKRTLTPSSSAADLESLDSRSSSPAVSEITHRVFPFKDPSFFHKGNATSGKKRLWRSLKQILSSERSLPWQQDDPTYSSIDAPPSFKPAKKYSDLSGLSANYTDPHTKIRYSNTEEFSRIRMLPMDIVSGYLALRKANIPVA